MYCRPSYVDVPNVKVVEIPEMYKRTREVYVTNAPAFERKNVSHSTMNLGQYTRRNSENRNEE